MNRSVLLMLAAVSIATAQMDPPSRVGRLNYMNGPVSFQPAGMSEWVDATLNRPLIQADQIWVGDRGRSELHVGSAALRLGPNTAFQFLNLDDQAVQIRLSEGTLSVRLRNLRRGEVFEVDMPNTAFTLLRAGDYRIDVNPDTQMTIITVRNGEGEASGGGQVLPIRSGQQLVVRGDDQIEYRLESSPPLDEWDQWCSSRDRREEQSKSVRYVSREMAGYEDLDQYGRWDNEPGYGNVWMPNSVSAGWAPYQDGHWAWISLWGWTWVDNAPWGFAPYHYGRWASFRGHWGWIPGPYGVTPVYAPALVAWVGGGRGGFSFSFSFGTSPAVGWFPLGPREPYFPSQRVSQGYFSRVNNTNTVINNTTINNYYNYNRDFTNTAITNIPYMNQRVQHGVTVVPQDSFARGRNVTQDARALTTAQLSSTQIFGAPAITPQRESVLGARAETASRAGRPAARVLERVVVARSAPPPAPVPFDRQQAELARNPGRPLPAMQVQQLRQSAPAPSTPVRVMDMGRAKRVQPMVGARAQQDQKPGPQRQQQQKQQQDVQREQQQKQQQEVQQQQRRQQQDSQRQQQQKQQKDVQREQQQKQQQEVQQQQRRQQQDSQRQQQQKQQQDVQREQQQKQQQEVQQQQRRQQQDSQRQQQQKQQHDVQREQQQKQQQEVQQQQRRQQQDSQRQQQQQAAPSVNPQPEQLQPQKAEGQQHQEKRRSAQPEKEASRDKKPPK